MTPGLLLAIALAPGCGRDRSPPMPDEGWRVFAVEYGRTASFRKRSLVHDAPKDARHPLSWVVFVLTGHDRVVLVDTGFDDADLAKRYRVEGRRTPQEALAGLPVRPDQVTDVVLTHGHWDHVGNLAPWTEATLWMRASELEAMRATVSEMPERNGIRLSDVRALDAAAAAGRVSWVDGDPHIAPGLVLHEGGKHTAHAQWVEVRTGGPLGTVVLAGDNAYLFDNIERIVPIGSSLDSAANREAILRMRRTAATPDRVVPGHDPGIFTRYPTVAPGIVEVR